MKQGRALLPLLLLLAPLAHGAEDCTLELKAIKKQYTAKLPKGFKLLSSKKDKRLFTEVLRLPDTTEVTATMGGCTHLAFTFTIKAPGLTPKTVGAELVAIARRVLPQLPMDKEAHADPRLMLKAIEEARIMSIPTELPCGEATCRMTLEAEPQKKPPKKKKKDEAPAESAGLLTLSYDFPL